MKKYKIALLTSSRSDYSLYFPLIKELVKENEIDLQIIAFGTHYSELHGNSAKSIIEDGFKILHSIESFLNDGLPQSISQSMGQTMITFSKIWASEYYDLLICLGDRYEMFAAVSSSIPFNIPIAHISGGETTLGAIDNVFRNALTVMSTFHFASTEQYKKRIIEMLDTNENVYNVGALSIDNLKDLALYTKEEFKGKFNIDMDLSSILITFHPETISFKKNEDHIHELIEAFKELKNYQLIITMPNADTMGNIIREKLNVFISQNQNAVGIESFGTVGYLTCMKYCKMMLGNTSSGFVEASFFPKYVINLGNRQKGRIAGSHIINCEIKKKAILDAVVLADKSIPTQIEHIYGSGNAAVKITQIIKSTIKNN